MKAESSSLPAKLGVLTKRQFLVLKHRADGLSQFETAKRLGTSRANVSMIELRAKRKLAKAKETLRAYESILSQHSVSVPRGTRLQEIPSIVLGEGDRYKTRLRSNLIDIIRMVKRIDPDSTVEGRSTQDLNFMFTQSGAVTLELQGTKAC